MMGAEAIKKLLTVISTVFLFFSLFLGISYAATEKTSKIILRVNNLTCSDCHRTISGELLQLDKNIQMNSERNKRSLIITYPDTLEAQEIVMVIQQLGYKEGRNTPKQKGSKVAHTPKNSRVTYGYCTSTCSASSSTWKQFYKRYFAKNK
jgi:cation transport ATPase